MSLLFVGPDTQEPISSLSLDGDAVWVASGPRAIKYLRGKPATTLINPLDTPLSFITIFGASLLALTEDGQRMLIWSTTNNELESTILFDRDFTATSILHPATYVNKMLVASSQGALQLWNVKTRTCIYKFSPSQLASSSLANPVLGCAITALVQSPAIDVVGIGFASGEISVYDVRLDERLMRMFMDGGIRALGFRSGMCLLTPVCSHLFF